VMRPGATGLIDGGEYPLDVTRVPIYTLRNSSQTLAR
jgi:hypothetical protein